MGSGALGMEDGGRRGGRVQGSRIGTSTGHGHRARAAGLSTAAGHTNRIANLRGLSGRTGSSAKQITKQASAATLHPPKMSSRSHRLTMHHHHPAALAFAHRYQHRIQGEANSRKQDRYGLDAIRATEATGPNGGACMTACL